MKHALPTVILALFMLSASELGTAQTAVPGFTNPSCETAPTNPPSGWVDMQAGSITGKTVAGAQDFRCFTAASVGCGTADDGTMVFVENAAITDNTSIGGLEQVIDLSSFGASVDGTLFNFSAKVRDCKGGGGADLGSLQVDFLDAGDAVLGTLFQDIDFNPATGSWQTKSVAGVAAPVNTRKVRVAMGCVRAIVSDFCDVDFDSFVLTTDSALPVELISFEALSAGRDVMLTWATASEHYNAGFEVQQRGVEAVNWHSLAFVSGFGTTQEQREYSYRIADVAPGRQVYRLKQIDFDGAFALSPEVEVVVALPSAFELSTAYPNPFNPEAHFTLSVSKEQWVRVEVFDVMGRRVMLLHDGVIASNQSQRFTIQGTHLPSGTYRYRAVGETFIQSRTVVLAK